MKILITTLLMASSLANANYSSQPFLIPKYECTEIYFHSYLPKEHGYGGSNATESWIKNWSLSKQQELETVFSLPGYVSRFEFGKLFCGE